MNSWLSKSFSALLVLSVLVPDSAGAAACCGGSFAAPSIIAGDDRAQLTASMGVTEVKINAVDADGVWYDSSPHQEVKSLKFEGAHIFRESWQAGFSAPLLSRSFNGKSATGLGDLSLDLGYEALPEWDYSVYRPRGIVFLQLNLPTGPTKMESAGGLDNRGSGFWALGVGTVLTKTFGRWDFLSSLRVHRSFAKRVTVAKSQGEAEPGFGGDLGIGAGYSPKAAWRLAGGITWSYEDPVIFRGRETLEGGPERYATASLSVNHMDGEEWAETISYVDQTLFGAPVNTSLGIGVMFQVQRRWGR